MREQLIEFENDGVTAILEWDELNPIYSVNVTVIPETQVNVTRSTASLTVTYNVMYNVSVIISHLCDQNGVIIFSEVYYYPCTSTCECPSFLKKHKIIAIANVNSSFP